VESDFPYCAMRTFTECGLSLRGPRLTVPDIKCAWSSCGEARHFSARTNEYLAYCTNRRFVAVNTVGEKSLTSVDATCSARRCAAIKMEGSLFCEKHTCHERDCDKPTDSGLYCEDRERHRCWFDLWDWSLTSARPLPRLELPVPSTLDRQRPGCRALLPSTSVHLLTTDVFHRVPLMTAICRYMPEADVSRTRRPAGAVLHHA
jgi:hypothetical protein